MEKIKKWVLALVVILYVISCSGRSSDEVSSDVNDSVYVSVAEIGQMFRDGVPAEKYMALQSHLVDLMHEGKAKDSPVEILSQSGYFYIGQRDYLKALEYLHEASDSLAKEPDVTSLRGKISLPGNLTNLYAKLGLYEDALQQNAKALEISRANGDLALSDLLRMRGAIYNEMYENNMGLGRESSDSALVYFDAAISMAHEEGTLNLGEVIRAEFLVNHPEVAPDSVENAMSTLRRIANEGGRDAATASAVLGHALIEKGEYSDGISYLETALANFKKYQHKESEEWTLGLLADGCVKAGRFDKLRMIYPQYTAIRDSIARSEKNNAVIGAEWRYRVKEKNRELAEAQRREEMTKKTLLLQRIILILAVFIIAAVLYLAIKKIGKERREKENARAQMNWILEHQQTLNQRIEQLNAELSSAKSKSTIENVAVELSPSVLLGRDEQAFRKAFATLHPNFLRDMRRDYPQITSNDELVLMLMRLHFSTDEIAMSLGIGRQSVISIRHRIRKKMNLDKTQDLDRIILSRQ